MSGYLLDTNVLSEFAKPIVEPRVREWMDSVRQDFLYTSVLTLAEIRKGIVSLPLSVRRSRLEDWLDGVLAVWFAGRLLPVDAAVAEKWAHITAKAEEIGRPLPTVDSFLAATALQHNLTLVTRDTGGLAVTGVMLFNPWID